MRICFLWTDISGYMASCWRTLSQRDGMDVCVITYAKSSQTSFDDELMEGIDWRRWPQGGDYGQLENHIRDFDPGLLIVPGWLDKDYRHAARHFSGLGVPCVLTMDTPWWGTFKQQLGRILLRPYARHFRFVAVTGERSQQYALRLGFQPNQVVRPLYGVDYPRLHQLFLRRMENSWPKRFLFVGRYADEKNIEALAEGYQAYRSRSSGPWPLITCGQGPLAHLLDSSPGIENQGFCQPGEVHDWMVRSAALILPSLFDPWPLITVEAAAAGLPVIYSYQCGSPVELVRDRFSGFQLGGITADAIADTLLEVEQSYAQLPEMGERATRFAEPYSCEFWAERWGALADRVARESA